MEIGKIIEALTICGSDIGCVKCPYDGHGCAEVMMKDAVMCLNAAKEIIDRGVEQPRKPKYQLKQGRKPKGKVANAVLMLDEDLKVLRRFDSAKDAADFIGKDQSYIRKCCRGQVYACGGYRWMYEAV